MPTRSSPAMGPRGAAGAAAGRGLGVARAAGRFLGAARRAAGLFTAAFLLSGLDFLRIAGFLAGAFLRLTLAFGLFFAAIMAPSVGCGGRTSVILVARTQHINLGPSGPRGRTGPGPGGNGVIMTRPAIVLVTARGATGDLRNERTKREPIGGLPSSDPRRTDRERRCVRGRNPGHRSLVPADPAGHRRGCGLLRDRQPGQERPS